MAPCHGAEPTDADAGLRDLLRTPPGLAHSAAIKRQAQRRARANLWVASAAAVIATGYNTNVFESFEDSEGAALLDLGVQVEAWRHFGTHKRLKLSARLNAMPFDERTRTDVFIEGCGASYRQDFAGRFTFDFDTVVLYENDHLVNPEGEDRERDYEHLSADAVPALHVELTSQTTLQLSWRVRRNDYVETPGLASFDSWRHGPALKLRQRVGSHTELELDYRLRFERFDADPARNTRGERLPDHPTDRHHFHSGEIELRVRPQARFELGASADIERKDDRFEDFESYTDRGLSVQAVVAVAKGTTCALAMRTSSRDYDHRPADNDAKLHADRLTLQLSGRHELTRYLALFGVYDATWRDTNRSWGLDYRDFAIHQLVTGVSLYF